MKALKRILLFFLLPLIVIIAAVLIYVSIGFGKLQFRDSFPVTADYAAFYPETYDGARQDFRDISASLSEHYNNVMISSIVVPSGTHNNLTIDICYVPAQKDSANLLIISSGIHGVEGFVGHAAQQLFIRDFLNEELLENTGVLLIHGVNPFGFMFNRRVTENNVDLNRNSPSTPDLYQTINDGYPIIYDLINPKGKVNRKSLENRFFFVKAINEIRKASLPVLRQAVLQGQYQFPEGLYFGGTQPEPQIEILEPLLNAWCQPYEKILAIDLHTGYGERGKLHFFPNPLEEPQRSMLEDLFEGYTIDWGDSEDFYIVTGQFVEFIGALVPGKEYYPMVFEYGTLNSQTTMGSIKSLHIMILENQGKHHGFKTIRDSLQVNHDFREMYYPSSENWRNFILDQTFEVFRTVLPRFTTP